MTADPKPPRLAVTAALAALAAAAWLAPLAALAVMPVYKKRFDEFGLKLPAATQAVMGFADAYWWAVAAAVFQLVAIVAVAAYVVRHRTESRLARALWWLLAFGPPLFALLLTAGPVLLAE